MFLFVFILLTKVSEIFLQLICWHSAFTIYRKNDGHLISRLLAIDVDFDLDLQVQPDLDDLPANMEDNEDAESTKSEVKLGKLQFSLDYDFQKGEVSSIFRP